MRTHPERARGLTLVELMVVMAVVGIVAIPVGMTMVNMVRSERRLFNEVGAARSLAVLETSLRQKLAQASADLRNDNQEVFEFWPNEDSTQVVLKYLVEPEEPGSIADLARYYYDAQEQQILVQDYVEETTTVLATDVTACRFSRGPAVADGDGYAGYDEANDAVLLVDVTVEVEAATFHKVIAIRAPNALGAR